MWGWRDTTDAFSINNGIMFNFGMYVPRKKKVQKSTNTWRCTLFGLPFFAWNRTCPQPICHPHLFPLYPPPHMGPCGLITISPFLCGGYSLGLQCLLSSLVETRFLLQEMDQSSLLLHEAFLTSLFTLLSTFLCTNFYCSTYHYVVKISVCFCTGL